MALVSTLHLGCSSHSSTIMLPGPDMIIDGPPVMVSRSLLPLHLPPLQKGSPMDSGWFRFSWSSLYSQYSGHPPAEADGWLAFPLIYGRASSTYFSQQKIDGVVVAAVVLLPLLLLTSGVGIFISCATHTATCVTTRDQWRIRTTFNLWDLRGEVFWKKVIWWDPQNTKGSQENNINPSTSCEALD